MRQILTEKLIANGHRRRREQILSSTSGRLHSLIELAECITGLKTDHLRAKLPWPKFVNQRPVPPDGNWPDWRYRDYDLWDELCADVLKLRPTFDANALLFLDDECPVFRSRLCEVFAALDEILNFSHSERRWVLAVVREDWSLGLLVTNYCGYLLDRKHRSFDEIVFELIDWGFVADGE